MKATIQDRPAYATCYLTMRRGEAAFVERDAMVAMSAGVSVTAGVGSGGIVSAAMRKAFGGEQFFVGRYQADTEGAWVEVGPRFPGDMNAWELDGREGLVLEAGAFVASDTNVDIDPRWAGVSNIVLRQGATMLHATGRGLVVFASYGGLVRHNLRAGEKLVIDSGHLVGWTDTTRPPQVAILGGVATSVATGEGLVAKFVGPGVVFKQTRAEQGLSSWLFPEREQNVGQTRRSR